MERFIFGIIGFRFSCSYCCFDVQCHWRADWLLLESWIIVTEFSSLHFVHSSAGLFVDLWLTLLYIIIVTINLRSLLILISEFTHVMLKVCVKLAALSAEW